ncbi:site-specific recombinase XerD [Hoeflea marina]|uniref:Site-specific recombinase XerD n=1 Tax=Hoeflea marina TaxID=274592 RepID=A0A317PF48_9HYPH|nr:site-specific integrase [Hoeflea marina]PWV98811.1 site-specific recombinase XerD [Hoeflea marina]
MEHNRRISLSPDDIVSDNLLPNDPVRAGALPPALDQLWLQHAGSLWENGRHKDSSYAFIFEILSFMQLHKITTYDDTLIDRLVDHFRGIGNRNSTINRKLSALYKLLKKAERAGQIPRLPSYLRLRERNSRVRFLTAEEEGAVFGAIAKRNPHHALLCEFLVDTGARIGEALALKWNDLHNNSATFWITKSGKSRTVPLTDRAVAALSAARAYGSAGPFTRITYPNFMYDWNRVRKDLHFLGDPHMVPHILRHTCASRLVQAGIDLRRVQTFLGHQTIQMTLRYAHLATDDLDQCARALNAINVAAAPAADPPAPRHRAPAGKRRLEPRAMDTSPRKSRTTA